MCEGATIPRTQEFYRAGTAPPVSEIPGSATVHVHFRAFLIHERIFYYLKVKKHDLEH